MEGWLILGFLLGLFFGLSAWRLFLGSKKGRPLALAEYWVYVCTPRVPPTEQIMTRMISDNPHNRKGAACITNREGMLFTDVRLRITAVLKKKNPHAFRPDLFEDEVTPTKETLERLAEAEGLIRILYASTEPLKDTRHLQFLPHLADAMADLCGGLVVLDRITQEFIPCEDFKEKLASLGQVERPDFHVRVSWDRAEDGHVARTHGLRKVGRSEWQTEPQESDTEVLITGLMLNAAHKVFRSPSENGPFSMEAYGGSFHLYLQPTFVGDRQVARLTREVAP